MSGLRSEHERLADVVEVSAPEPYQKFFAALARAMFLEGQQVE